MKTLVFWVLIFCVAPIYSQATKITGKITDEKGEALIGANVFLEGTYDGAASDTSGHFSFSTLKKGTYKLNFSFLGYKTLIQEINLPEGNKPLEIKLAEIPNELNEVVITAGTYQAGDRKRGVQLTSLEVLTIANSNGDFVGAMNTLPGTQNVGEDGGLFVRGGDRSETKTYIDGLMVAEPYHSKSPDLPTRGRFSPMLFSGTLFSTGGYSAEYGQALSAALILNTSNLQSNNPQSINIFPFGCGGSYGKSFDSTAVSLGINYYNMAPYFAVVPQSVNWIKYPQELSGTLITNSKIGKKSYLKVFSSASIDKSAMELPEYIDPFGGKYFEMDNKNLYVNSVYTSRVGAVDLKTGVSYSRDNENIDFKKAELNTNNSVLQLKQVVQFGLGKNITLRNGIECYLQQYKQTFQQPDSFINAKMDFANALTAVFSEGESKVGEKMSVRIGLRGEYASLNSEATVSPRISMAYKTGAKSQVSAAYGFFNQLPRNDYFKYNNELTSERAIHYILNYQYQTEGYLFRVEGYYKDYQNLTRYTSADAHYADAYTSNGKGYAKGIDVFWRDQKSIPNTDYWVSFTLLDAKKVYQNYPGMMYPTYFSRYNAATVFKRYFSKLKMQGSATYQYSSGRPYLDLTDNNTMHYTKDLNNLSLSISYLTRLFDKFTVIYVAANNVLGFEQVYGYHFIKTNNGGETAYQKMAIKSPAKRFVMFGIFISLNNKF